MSHHGIIHAQEMRLSAIDPQHIPIVQHHPELNRHAGGEGGNRDLSTEIVGQLPQGQCRGLVGRQRRRLHMQEPAAAGPGGIIECRRQPVGATGRGSVLEVFPRIGETQHRAASLEGRCHRPVARTVAILTGVNELQRLVGSQSATRPRSHTVIVHTVQHRFWCSTVGRLNQAQRVGDQPEGSVPLTEDPRDHSKHSRYPRLTADDHCPGSRSHGAAAREDKTQIASRQTQARQIPRGFRRTVEEFNELGTDRRGTPQDLREDHLESRTNRDLKTLGGTEVAGAIVGHPDRDGLGDSPGVVVCGPLQETAHRVNTRPVGSPRFESEAEVLGRLIGIRCRSHDTHTAPLFHGHRCDGRQHGRLIDFSHFQEQLAHHRKRIG